MNRGPFFLVWALAVLTLQCDRGPRPLPERGRLVGSPAALTTSNRVESEPNVAAVVSAEPAAPAETPAHAVVDPAFDLFSARLHARCDPKQPGETIGERVADANETVRCLRARISTSFEKAPVNIRHALSVGRRSDHDDPAFSPGWEQLVNGVCGLDDAATWIGEVSRQAGAMRYVDGAGCSIPSLVEAAYLLDRIAEPRGTTAFARRVRATQAPGRARLDALQRVRSSLVRLGHIAHEDALFDDACFYCKLSDSDWRRLTLDVDAVRQESDALARAVCGAWAELAAELGGVEACVPALRAHFAWYLAEIPAPFGEGVHSGAYSGYPPPKDPAYRAYVEPLVDACRAGEPLGYASDEFESRALGCLRGVVPSRVDQAGVRQAIDAYVAHLCPVEQRVVRADIGPTTDVHQRLADDRVETIDCPMLAAERRAYALWAWARDDAAGFATHVRARGAWARRVRIGSSRVRRIAAAETCPDYSEVFGGTCRSPALSQAEWASLSTDVAALPDEAARVAGVLCASWPALGIELGVERCTTALTDYFLSYPVFLGLAALDARN